MPKFDQYATQIRILREYGLQTWAAFTLGYDHDTLDSVRATLDFALENRFTFAAFNILMPYPNTPLYERLAREGRHLYDGQWWLHPHYRFNDASFVPARMTPDELTAVCYEARKEFNRIPSLLLAVLGPQDQHAHADAHGDVLALQSGVPARGVQEARNAVRAFRPLLTMQTRVRSLSICRSGGAHAARGVAMVAPLRR